MQDSFFGMDGRGELSPNSTFGPARSSGSGMGRRDIPSMPDDIGGVVIDTPVSPLRH